MYINPPALCGDHVVSMNPPLLCSRYLNVCSIPFLIPFVAFAQGSLTSVARSLTRLQQTLGNRYLCRRQLYLSSFSTGFSCSPSLLLYSLTQPFSPPLSLGLCIPRGRGRLLSNNVDASRKLLDCLDAV